MARLDATPEVIENILSRIPEGFIRYDFLCQRVKLERNMIPELIGGIIARDGDWWYDSSRLTQEQVQQQREWAKPYFPDMDSRGQFAEPPIAERQITRDVRIDYSTHAAACRRIIAHLAETRGYALKSDLAQSEGDEAALEELVMNGDLRMQGNYAYDPLRISQRTIKQIADYENLIPVRDAVIKLLEERPGQTATQAELNMQFGSGAINQLLQFTDLKLYHIETEMRPYSIAWIRLASVDPEVARQVASEESQQSWDKTLAKCGAVLRPGAKDGKTARMQVLARSYTVSGAAQRLGIRQVTIQKAIDEDRIPGFDDPEGKTRIPAEAIEAISANPEYAEHITAYETITPHDLALALGQTYSQVRRRLQKIGIRRHDPRWGDVRGQFDLPETFKEFRDLLKERAEDFKARRDAERREKQRVLEEERTVEREQRAELRAKLVAAFPAWQHEGRIDQMVRLHVGPPNSGKTHEALEALTQAGSGWYLAPLRLLAFEIFDRLNQRGILCNLLTGEEHIPIPGATITAATVEMFNPHESGECVVIDEAQMLADVDRGWAWTRAFMEAQSPDIRIIGPETVRNLIERMASAAAVPLEIIPHERLAPIQVADHHWPLHDLPARTILVAFSRQMVLHLKTELERMKRTVSVVYGNLPPEVRRKQADRFASSETEICVATDAVGMGLNLPADYVCFYEIEKFDGREIRMLTPAEIQQIGGRAGRYGLSTVGEVGTTSKRDLKMIRTLFVQAAQELTHARVAPTVQDLEIIPGTLASKLTQWAQLQSIPESLRGVIQTADMSERIELASMLTDREVKLLGLEAALKLVNAPTRQNTREYWYNAARAILTDKEIALPPVAPKEITNSIELESIEYCVACADIYLWLSQRREFAPYATYEPDVREMRADWSMRIDRALLRKISTVKRCARCGKLLSIKHRFTICDDCFYGRGRHNDELDELA